MRLGAPVIVEKMSPEAWIAALRNARYGATYWPLGDEAGEADEQAYVAAAAAADIVIAEVGAWSNPLSSDDAARAAAIELCQRRLALADRVAARCCVNIAGSRSASSWAGPHPHNLTDDTFDAIVQTTRQIIDTVRPTRTFYALEMMPWTWPDSAESYLQLITAIDRPRFGVHLDPVNIVNSPRAYAFNGRLIRNCFALLGPYIRSCHGKDIIMHDRLTVHLDETAPGRGGLDYRTFLSEMNRLDPDTPLMLEHLKAEEYPAAAEHVRSVAGELGLAFAGE